MPRTDNFAMRLALLFVALATAVPLAGAQPAASFATPERDAAAVYMAEGEFIVSRIATECLELVGRAQSPKALLASWKGRNARFVKASAKYIEMRLQEAEARGPGEREALEKQVRAAVEGNGEASLRSLLQGRREEGCMYGVTLIDTGTLDVLPSSPQYKQLDALARWAEQ